MRPALVVLAVAAGIVLLFGVLAAVSSSGSHGTPPLRHPTRVPGTGLRAVPATAALRPIEHPGTPPSDVLDALRLPEGAVPRGHRDLNTSSTQYDEQMRFSVKATEAAVVDFYKAGLKKAGWKVFDVGHASHHPGAVEVLAQRGASDGWYWEVGAVVSPTSFGRSGDGQTTQFTLRLFQESDST